MMSLGADSAYDTKCYRYESPWAINMVSECTKHKVAEDLTVARKEMTSAKAKLAVIKPLDNETVEKASSIGVSYHRREEIYGA